MVARECALIRTAFKEDDNQFRRLAEKGGRKGMMKGETDNSMNIVFFLLINGWSFIVEVLFFSMVEFDV